MKKPGCKKTKTRVEGHQECSTCHPATKGGKAKEKILAKKRANEYDDICKRLMEFLIEESLQKPK